MSKVAPLAVLTATIASKVFAKHYLEVWDALCAFTNFAIKCSLRVCFLCARGGCRLTARGLIFDFFFGECNRSLKIGNPKVC
jgi:hypothetical protein